MHWSFLEDNSYYVWAASAERDHIQQEWDQRDRSTIQSYDAVLAIRRLRDARLACSAAIAGRRRAIDLPGDFHRWLRHQDSANRVQGPWVGWGSGTGSNGSGTGWNTGWRRDPTWDGVTRIPKTPGKAKRRRLALRAHREAAAQAHESYLLACARSEEMYCYPHQTEDLMCT
ncbi:hypothetical protein C8R43DRAFT_1136452 [Mycena crocata]|nr:hypothetical protein C8R43DRAFT_1136452 [Mycena crocata]